MKILVSGASGLIGRALVTELDRRGDEVVVLVRPGSAPSERTSVAWDPSRREINRAALEAAGTIDGVVHLAGAGIADGRWTSARRSEILRSRVDGTTTLATAIAEMAEPPKAFLSGSAIGYYGDAGEDAVDEKSPAGSGFLAEVCEQWEASAAAAADAGIRTALLRTGIVLSPAGGALKKQLPLFKAGLGGRMGSGRQWMSWISIDDEIAAIVALLGDLELEGPVDLTAPEPVRNADFTKALAAALRRPAVLPVPSLALRAALGGELVDEALLASQRVKPTRLLEAGFAFSHKTIDQALASLLA